MKKTTTMLLGGALLLSLNANAENKFYASEELGDVYGISDNGRYAAICDDENIISYMWCIDNPTEFVQIKFEEAIKNKVELYDVSDDGVFVGARFADSHTGQMRPGYYKDGKWYDLPVPSQMLNSNAATGISPDGKIISGHLFCYAADSANGGRFFPTQWVYDETTGEYVLNCYNDIDLPKHQGFYTTGMSADGAYIGGMTFGGAMSVVPSLMENGELKLFNKFTSTSEPFMYKGKYVAYDAEGKQYFTEDANDPNIFYIEEYFVDGFHDTDSQNTFNGGFAFFDWDGNVYGYRTVAENVDEDGNGTLRHYATIYNLETGEFKDNEEISMYACGLKGGKYIFISDARMIADGNISYVADHFKIDVKGLDMNAVTKIDRQGKVLGGTTYVVNPANGERQYFPFLVVLEDALDKESGVKGIGSEAAAEINVNGNIVTFAGAEGTVYTMDGRIAGEGMTVALESGIYVARCGNQTVKVVVK